MPGGSNGLCSGGRPSPSIGVARSPVGRAAMLRSRSAASMLFVGTVPVEVCVSSCLAGFAALVPEAGFAAVVVAGASVGRLATVGSGSVSRAR